MAINETATGNDSVAITGTASAGERTVGIKGIGDSAGIRGEGKTWNGVEGISHSTTGGAGVFGMNDNGSGVVGESKTKFNAGVFGIHKGDSNNGGFGVRGQADNGTAMAGESKTWMGVYGKTKSTTGGAGVMGEGNPGSGVIGKSSNWNGVYGETTGVEGGAAGVWGEYKGEGEGVGVKAVSKTGTGLYAFSDTGKAGWFDGNVFIRKHLEVHGDVSCPNADCAEDFDVSKTEDIEPGTVMSLNKDGVLGQCQQAYDKRVAGVVSGAGDYKPAIILDKQAGKSHRKPIALMGKVYCKVDASYEAIEIGDLLTTSNTLGHAMKASEPLKASGSVIGKALRPLKEGQGLIPILVSLQ